MFNGLRKSKNITGTFLFIIILCLFGCDSKQEQDFKRGLNYQNAGEFREAVAEFERVMKRDPGSMIAVKAARENAKILLYDLKNYDKAIESLKYLILHSKSSEERWKSQSQIAQIYFDNLAWYDRALVEYSKLLASSLSEEETYKIKLAVARSYYYLGQFSQSWSEINQIKIEPKKSFDVLLLKANIRLALKDYAEAAKGLEKILIDFPDESKKENVGINLALCYEELGVYKEALRVLEQLRLNYEPKEYIELRIKKINERYSNQPKKRVKK